MLAIVKCIETNTIKMVQQIDIFSKQAILVLFFCLFLLKKSHSIESVAARRHEFGCTRPQTLHTQKNEMEKPKLNFPSDVSQQIRCPSNSIQMYALIRYQQLLRFLYPELRHPSIHSSALKINPTGIRCDIVRKLSYIIIIINQVSPSHRTTPTLFSSMRIMGHRKINAKQIRHRLPPKPVVRIYCYKLCTHTKIAFWLAPEVSKSYFGRTNSSKLKRIESKAICLVASTTAALPYVPIGTGSQLRSNSLEVWAKMLRLFCVCNMEA